MVYHPDRLRYPLRRIGERGAGKWEHVSWEEALDGIAAKLQALIRQHGPASIAWNADYAAAGSLKWAGYSRLASLTKGIWLDIIGIDDSAGPCADLATYGALGGLYRVPRDPKRTIVWGLNPTSTSYRSMRMIMREKKSSYPVYSTYLRIQQRIIEPLHESKSDFQIAAGLGRKMGLGAYFDKTDEQYLEELLASGHPSMEGVTLARLKGGPVKAKSVEGL